jgi:cytochrome c oxidase assembly protein subunit 15
VTLYKQELGIFHGTLAQLFLVLMSAIALFLSRGWKRLIAAKKTVQFHPWYRPVLLTASVLVLVQLVLGATMRHQHAGLAVPDFPLAYGKLWPPTDEAFLQQQNNRRTDYREFAPITATQIHLHMTHRLTACAILVLVGACALLARKSGGARVAKLSAIWFGLILGQAFLGAYTVWSNKAADVATAHVAIGALSLVWGVMLYIGTAPLAQCVLKKEIVSVPAGSPALT